MSKKNTTLKELDAFSDLTEKRFLVRILKNMKQHTIPRLYAVDRRIIYASNEK